MIPCFVFSIIYYFMFRDKFDLVELVLGMFSGIGHMWFLPMLFWCFIMLWFVDKYKFNSKWLIFFLAGLSIIPFPSLPFGFSRVFHFYFYCYGGYLLYINRKHLYDKFLNNKSILMFFVVYVILIIVTFSFVKNQEAFTLVQKIIRILSLNFLKFIYSVSGIMFLYLLVNKFTYNKNFTIKKWVINATTLCYGVYIFQQFILKFLYYKTNLPLIGSIWLPWVGFIITIILSIMLTKISLKTKTGRFLLG